MKKEKNNMKKLNLALAAVLSVVTLFGAVIPVNAASAEVTIEVKQTLMDNVSVTVPSLLPIVFNEDGTNTLPSTWKIENISPVAGVHLAKIDMNGGNSGWKLLPDSVDTKTMDTDVQAIKFFVGKEGNLKLVTPTGGAESEMGSITFEENEISVASGEKMELCFDIARGAFTSPIATKKAFDMVLTFEIN